MSKKQKPDLLAMLAIVVILGVIGSSVAQGMFKDSGADNQLAANAKPAISETR